MLKKIRKPVAILALFALVFASYVCTFPAVEYASAASSTSATSFFAGEVIASSVEYGDTFTVPVSSNEAGGNTVEVYAPNGMLMTNVTDTVTASEIGIYEIFVRDNSGDGYYSYNVECYLDGDYMFLVDKAGATIPSNWEYDGTTANAIQLPDANIYVYDEVNEIYVKDNSQVVNVIARSPNGTTYNYTVDKSTSMVTSSPDGSYALGDYISELKLDTVGTWFITYYTEIDNNAEIFSEEFTIQVRTQFEDETAPKLSVSSFSSNASVNTKVTLPTATVSDDYDENIIVDISVMHTYEGTTSAVDVPVAVVDMVTGYASGVTTETALFDNDNFMYFYPTEVGTYTVIYVAQDTSCYYGIETTNKTVEYVYTINVTDTTAPIFYEIDDYKIPSTWASVMYKSDGSNSEVELENTNIEFPIPVLTDNYDTETDLTARFTLSDPNGITVATFTDITSTTHNDYNQYPATSNLKDLGLPYYFFDIDESVYSVDSDGLITVTDTSEEIGYDFASVFNFDLWAPSYDGASKTGSYEATYRAYDNAASRNYRQVSYSIEFNNDSETDTGVPSVYFDTPSNIVFTNNDEDVSVDSISFTDTQATRLDIGFYLVYNVDSASLGNADYGTILNTSTKVRIDGTSSSVTLEDVAMLDGYGSLVVDDYLGNRTEITDIDTSKYIYVIGQAIDSVGNTTARVEMINAVDGTDTTNKTTDITATDINTDSGYVGEQYLLGDFAIEYEDGDRTQTGFELYVQRIAYADGTLLTSEETPLSNVTFETYSDNTESYNQLHVDNVRFTANQSGTYMVVFRSYHVSGYSSAYICYVDIESKTSTGSGNITTASSLSLNSELNVTYTLQTEYEADAGDYIVRSISGGKVSFMYDEFTAMSQVTYTFSTYSATPEADGTISYDESYKPTNIGTTFENDSTSVNDSESPVIKLQGIVPVYVENTSSTVVLPTVSAYSSNGVATTVECKVTDFDGNSVTVSGGDAVTEGCSYSFVADTDGTYTVVYTASINGNEATATYTIYCGDVTAPQFTVVDTGLSNSTGDKIICYIDDEAVLLTASASVTASVGDTFKFAIIQVDEGESTDNYSYSKKLYASDASLVDSVTNATARSSSSRVEFTMSGQYTVEYVVTDYYGNETTLVYYITVSSSSINVSTETITTLSVVLIIVGIILLAGVVIYLIRFKTRNR